MTATTKPKTLDIKHTVIGPAEHEAVTAVLTSADLSGNARAVTDYEKALRAWFTSPHAVACSSGTAALHLAMLALGIAPGDEVIVSAAAPAMTALPVLALGAVPVFADVAHPATFALDRDDVAAKTTGRTKAVITVPMWGYPADGTDLAAACAEWGLPLIEDAAQAHGTLVDGRYAGTHATIGTFSTHARKIMTTGEGGFCLTSDDTLNEKLRQIRNLGQPDAGGPFGAAFGLNFKLPAISAALGTAQLARLARRVAQRLETLDAINAIVADSADLTPFPVRDNGTPNAYAALFTSDRADAIAHRLADAAIASDPLRYGYRPVYHTPAVSTHAPKCPCANAERLSHTLVTLPCHEGVAAAELRRIEVALHG
jgi:perosamine synthetase